jgi:hypothetical protein
LGLVSGIATAPAARVLAPQNPLVGVVFGVAITLLVWIKYKTYSAWYAVALLASSVVAYFVAIWGTLAVMGRLTYVLSPDSALTEPLGPGMFSVAGFLGGIVVNLALLLLFSRDKPFRLAGKAAAFACAGAFLGFLGSELAEPVGGMIASVVGVPPVDMGSNQYYQNFYSTYLIWQTGMAFLIPLMLPHMVISPPGQATTSPRSPAGLTDLGKLFFACIFATLVFLACFVARDYYRNRKHSGFHNGPTVIAPTQASR